jgi:putative transcriptional regulator
MQPSPFAALIAELRERLRLSQERLAAALHVSFPTINRWENGKSEPDLATRQSIANFIYSLGPNFSDLYKRFPHEPLPHEQPRETGTSPGRSLRKRFSMDFPGPDYEAKINELTASILAIVRTMSDLNDRFPAEYAKNKAAADAAILSQAKRK